VERRQGERRDGAEGSLRQGEGGGREGEGERDIEGEPDVGSRAKM
jgi:hypothetical protein